MIVYTVTGFEGFWPVGTAAVVIARNEEHARQLLDTELAGCRIGDMKKGLQVGGAKFVPLLEDDHAGWDPDVRILCDGNY